MSTKRIGIDLIQNRLASGDAPNDLRGRYPRQVIEMMLTYAYAEIIGADPTAKRDMSVSADLTRAGTAGAYYVTLPKYLMTGSTSITWVESCGKWIPLRTGITDQKTLSILVPNTEETTCYLSQTLLKFNGSVGETVTLYYIPDVRDMDDDDVLYSAGKENAVYQAVIQAIRATDTRPEEVLANQREDMNGRAS